MKRAFKVKQKEFFIIFQGLRVSKNCLTLESAQLSSVQYSSAFKFKSRTLCIYLFICIKLQERLIKIQLAHISKSYLKFQHVP